MKFETPLVKGTLIKRYKRFLADIRLENGEEITAHCANPGAMLGLKQQGSTVWLSKSTNPKRKLAYSWELIEVNDHNITSLVGINTSHPNKIVEEAILNGTIKPLQGYKTLRREVKYGTNSRIDILLQDNQTNKDARSNCYVEVKNVHLLRQKNLAEFPDSVTTRGTKHLNELAEMVNQGHRAVMIYLIQRMDVTRFKIAADIDKNYAAAFEQVMKKGVEAYAFKCELSPEEIILKSTINLARK